MNVFAAAQQFKSGFRSDNLKMSFGGSSVAGFIVQNVKATFNQQVSTIYEIGSSSMYYVGGRAQGNASLTHIVGPTALAGSLIRKFGDLCNPEDINLDASAGCTAGGINYTLQDAVLLGLEIGTDAQQPFVTQGLSFLFSNMDYQG